MNIFDSYIDAGQVLDKAAKAEFYTALIEYIAYGIEPEFKKTAAKAVFTAIQPSLLISKQRSESGKKGMKSRYQNADLLPNKTANKRESNRLTNSNSNSNSKETTPNGVVKKGNDVAQQNGKRFVPPTESEVQQYGEEWMNAKGKHAAFSAERFCAFYASKGWMVGSNKMKDWKQAVRGWILRDIPEEKGVDSVFEQYT